MIASCHRRSGNYQQALESYKHIHKRFPDNIECLKVSPLAYDNKLIGKHIDGYSPPVCKEPPVKASWKT